MKWWLIIGLLFLLAGYSPQLRTRYTPPPAIARVYRKVWRARHGNWAVAVAFVKIA